MLRALAKHVGPALRWEVQPAAALFTRGMKTTTGEECAPGRATGRALQRTGRGVVVGEQGLSAVPGACGFAAASAT